MLPLALFMFQASFIGCRQDLAFLLHMHSLYTISPRHMIALLYGVFDHCTDSVAVAEL
jgi:hypothetical protein